jgi:TonB family protein
MLVSLLLQASPVWAGDDVEQTLKAEFQDKVLTLRHPYKGDRLTFQPDGGLMGVANLGPWTIDSQVSILDIKLHDNELRIHGRRVFLVFDAEAKPYRDVLNLLSESSSPDREKMEKYFESQQVEIEIGLPSDQPGLDEASKALNAAFLAPGESMAGVVPDFWRDYFDQQEGRPRTPPPSSEAMFSVKPPSGTMPRAIHSPEPEYSDEARRAKYQGTMTVSIVADASGATRDVQVVKPLGMGLDEKAVESVRNWTFEPAKKDGAPVSIQLMIEVDFHLY